MKHALLLFLLCLLIAGAATPEETLSKLANRPRIESQQWGALLGGNRLLNYKIKKGDTLWKISKKLFHDGYFWRKLWEVNPEITNPHDLVIGSEIRYYKEMQKREVASENRIEIERVKLVPQKGSTDLETSSDSIVARDIKDSYYPRFFILGEQDKELGEVKGSYAQKEGMGDAHDAVYLKPAGSFLQPNERYSIVRVDRDLRDRTQPGAPSLGRLAYLVAEVEVEEMGEFLAKSHITKSFDLLKRGDKIYPLKTGLISNLKIDPPNELQTQIVGNEQEGQRWLSQGQLVLLNKGSNEGMKAGFLFRAWRDTDKITQDKADVEPESKGEVLVIHSTPTTSLGYILKSQEPLMIGDTLVPRQVFSDLPKPPMKHVQTLEID